MNIYKVDYVGIGRRIREKRMERGLTLEELGERMGLSITYIRGIETGKIRLNLESLMQTVSVLQVSADELLWDNFRHDYGC